MSILESELRNDQSLKTLFASSSALGQDETSPAEDRSRNACAQSQEPSLCEMDIAYDQAQDMDTFSIESHKDSLEPQARPSGQPLSTVGGTRSIPLSAVSMHHDDQPADLITPEVERELIDIYFTRIQAWLPLLHRPRFYEKYVAGPASQKIDLEALSIEERLVFKCMFALAARHSNSPAFAGVDRLERGSKLADEARILYELARMAVDPPNLIYLQGCILLAFYWYTSGPCARGWILSGVCVRLAYDLDLCGVDEEDSEGLDVEEWVRREELRRAFWLVWELDTFGSTVSMRPYAIDRRRIAVLLPVSDEAWFAETPVSSARLEADPSKLWKSLQKCENQDERAWFLVANFLMSISHDLKNRRDEVTVDEKFELENAFNCFKLSLPSKFNLETAIFTFDSLGFARSNWIISTHLMMAGCGVVISNLSAVATSPNSEHRSLVRVSQLHSRATDISRVISRWSPDFVSLAHPFISCTLLPIHIPGDETDLIRPDFWCHQQEVVKLILSRFAQVWKLGTTLLTLATLLEKPQEMNPKDFEIARRFAVYFPRAITNRKLRTPSIVSRDSDGDLIRHSNQHKGAHHGVVEANTTPHRHQNEYVALAPMRQNSRTSEQMEITSTSAAHAFRISSEDPRPRSGMSSAGEVTTFVSDALEWQDSDPNWNSNLLDFFGRTENLDFLEF